MLCAQGPMFCWLYWLYWLYWLKYSGWRKGQDVNLAPDATGF
jgi:hypothetical protein